eukprot:CAMPEP_0185745874 /NCGR_PEP_ID=MMETSP1174-20130828/4265_1 /TAXON_ID=35687 /ORGANISM="Dictyocha speculum, Strain CCMP1381" /LENGTH=193 /DNA_ID=CAMNT_0028420143 /DNA_START=32 /DNA_END=609 /DNA_ORIENTATION=+
MTADSFCFGIVEPTRESLLVEKNDPPVESFVFSSRRSSISGPMLHGNMFTPTTSSQRSVGLLFSAEQKSRRKRTPAPPASRNEKSAVWQSDPDSVNLPTPPSRNIKSEEAYNGLGSNSFFVPTPSTRNVKPEEACNGLGSRRHSGGSRQGSISRDVHVALKERRVEAKAECKHLIHNGFCRVCASKFENPYHS